MADIPQVPFLPTGIWGDEYRDAGGVVVPDFLAEQERQNQARQAGYDAFMQEQDLTNQVREQQLSALAHNDLMSQFVDWNQYQQLASANGITNPRDQWDDYTTTMLPYQLRALGYSDEEIQQEVQAFAKLVQPPAADYGFLGNLWESLKGGAKGATQGLAGAKAMATGDTDALAKMIVDQATGEGPVAPLRRFQESIADTGPPSESFDFMRSMNNIARFVGVAALDPNGFANWAAQTAGQQYPVAAASLAGAGAGAAIGGPAGGAIGGFLGMFASDAAEEAGSQITEYLQKSAQAAGVDPTDIAALSEYVKRPEVYSELRNAAVKKGVTVAVADGMVTALSLGLGRAAALAQKTGRTGRAAALATTGVVSEPVGSAIGEAASQAAAGQGFSYEDITGELFGDVALGALHTGAGAAYGLLRRPVGTNPPGTTPPAAPPEPGEEEMAAFGQPLGPPPTLTGGVVPPQPGLPPVLAVGPEGGAFNPTPENVAARDRVLAQQIGVQELPIENIDIGPPNEPPPGGGGGTGIEVTEPTVEQITIPPVSQILDNAETRIERLLTYNPNAPLTVTPEGVVATPEQLEAQRIAHLTTPQPAELNVKDASNMRGWMEARGVVTTPQQDAILEDLAGTRQTDRRSYIADVIDGLAASTNPNDATFADGLLAIARSIPREPQPKSNPIVDLGPDAKTIIIDAAVQDVVQSLAAGVTNAVTPTESAAPATTKVAPVPAETIQQPHRGLRAGERVPTPSLSALANQLVGAPSNEPTRTLRRRAAAQPAEGAAGAPTVQEGPRGGLRSRRAQAGAAPVAGGVVAGANAATAGRPAPNARAEPTDIGSTPGVPRLVRGTQYGAQAEDVANKEAAAQQRADQRAKKQVRGLRKRAIDAVTLTKEEYEAKYPGRSYEKDIESLMDNSGARPETAADQYLGAMSQSAVAAMRNLDSALAYISATAPSPLARLIADRIRALNLDIPIVFRNIHPADGAAMFVVARDGRGAAIVLDPRRASVKSALHEMVHAATLAILRNPQTAQEREAANYLNALYEHALTVPELASNYGMKNTAEFVAEAMSNPGFQAALKKVPLPGKSKFASMWDAFKAAVMKLLGMNKSDNLLSEALLASTELFSSRTPGSAMRFADQAKAVRAPSSAILGMKDGVRTFIAYQPKKGVDAYTLYPTDPENLRGVRGAGVAGLSRADVEKYITDAGSQPIAPANDGRVTGGVPKNTSTKLVGFSQDGDLKVAAYEQKDGTWTYYQSDADVRSDPDANVQKGLTKDQVQRYIAQAGLLTEAPAAGAVQPNSATTTAVGYEPASEFRTYAQDIQRPIKAIGEGQEKAGVSPLKNAGKAANLMNSAVQRVYDRVRRNYVEPVKQEGNRIARQWGKTQDEILSTLADLHVVERMNTKIQQTLRGDQDPARIRNYQAKQAAAQARIDAIRNANPGYLRDIQQGLAPLWKRLTDNNTDMAAQYGRISREVAESIKRAYDYYVPLQTGEKTTSNKAATGANVETDQSFARVVEQAHRIIQQGEFNRIYDLVAQQAEAGLATTSGEPTVFVGQGTKVRYDPETNSLSEEIDSKTFNPNTVFFYRNGERIPMTIKGDPALLRALKPFTGDSRNMMLASVMAISSAINRIIAVGKTTMSPAFAPRNFMRDIQTANVNLPQGVSRIKFHKELVDIRNWAAVANGVMRDLVGAEHTGGYGEAKDIGAFISHRDYVNLKPISNDLDQIFRLGFNPQSGNALAKRSLSKSFEALSLVSQIFESVTRYAMYKAALDSGKANGMTDAEAKVFAANAAKTASVNFEQRGQRNLSNLYIFGNAKLQGLSALADTGKRVGPLKATAGASAIITLGAVAAALQQHNCEKDRDGICKATKLSDFIKDNKVYFSFGGPAIPISQEISPLYILGHAMMEHALGATNNVDTASRIATGFVNNILPTNVPQSEVLGYKSSMPQFVVRSVLPSPFQPLADIGFNKTTFGSDLVYKKDERLKRGIPLSDMGSANENELAVNVAKGLYNKTGGAIDVAPQQLRVIHNYFDPLTEEYAFFRDLFTNREPKYAGEVVNPLKRGFTASGPTGFYDQDQFDELLSKAQRAKYMADHNGRSSLTPEDQALADSAGMLNKIEKDISAMFKGQQMMTREKRQLLQEQANARLLEGIRRYNELRDRRGLGRSQ